MSDPSYIPPRQLRILDRGRVQTRSRSRLSLVHNGLQSISDWPLQLGTFQRIPEHENRGDHNPYIIHTDDSMSDSSQQ